MTAEMAHEPSRDEDELLLEGFFVLDTPEGYRAEFIEGEIVVSPPPDGDHEGHLSRINRQMARHSKVPMDTSGHKGLELVRGGRCTKNYLIPDAVFAPLELDLFWGAPSWMSPAGVELVVEVTSSKPDRDRGVKRHCYAKADVPLFLLIDRSKKTVTLFSEPDPGAEDYKADVRVAFGTPIELPPPFAFTLRTDEFR